jgi:hypothetical protein
VRNSCQCGKCDPVALEMGVLSRLIQRLILEPSPKVFFSLSALIEARSRVLSLRDQIGLLKNAGSNLLSKYCRVFVDALLAIIAKSTSKVCRNVPMSTLTLNNPLGKSAVGLSAFLFSFIPTPTIPEPNQPTMECFQVVIGTVA